MKVCSTCKVEKPNAEFSKNMAAKDGFSSSCKPCASAYHSEWRKKNSESIAEYASAWQKANPEKCAERNKRYRDSNKEKISESGKSYHAENKQAIAARKLADRIENPEKFSARSLAYRSTHLDLYAAHCRTRRSRKLNADGSHTAEDIKAIFDSQRGLCATCAVKLIKSGKNRYHVDHIQPLSKGGSNDKYNLQCLCPDCNQRKHAKDPYEWANENGRLL